MVPESNCYCSYNNNNNNANSLTVKPTIMTNEAGGYGEVAHHQPVVNWSTKSTELARGVRTSTRT